jgi:8-oxo-dGTP pyrophosphatase MutT (NUDIX family)
VNRETAPHGLSPLDRIRRRLAEGPRREGEFNGDGRDLAPPRPPTPAAVLVPLVVREQAPSVLLTRRTDHLHHHPGQISFPGGRLEADDASPVHAALRETEEEIGLARSHVELIGALPDYLTGTGFRVTPVVGLVHPPFDLTLDAFEVAEAFEVPLAHFLDPRNHQEHSILHEGRMRRFHAMPWHGYFIWGATAGILMSLYRLLHEEA